MAFKVLNEEQIALLTDDQKKQYEKALDLYNERAAFVQRINALENVQIPSYEPKLQEIAVIDGIPESDYAVPELTVKTYVPAAKPKPQYNVLKLDGSINAVLPQFSKAAQVEVGHIKKAEAIRPELPEAIKVEEIAISFTKPEKMGTILPEIVKVEETAISFTKPEKMGTVLPEIVKVEKIAISIKKSEKMEAVLPEITIGHTDIKEYKKPKQAQNKVPVVRKPEITVKSERPEPVCAVLPELSGVETADVKFTKPEISSVEVPTISRPNLVVHDFDPVEYSVADLPDIREPRVKLPELSGVEIADAKFTRPEISNAEVPTIPRPDLPVHVFEPVEYSLADLPDIREPRAKIEKVPSLKHRKNDRKPELPRVEKISVADVVFKPVKTAEPKIPVTSMLPVRVKPFAKVESRVKGMPGLSAVTIPNARERLKEVLSTAFLPDNIAETEVEKSER